MPSNVHADPVDAWIDDMPSVPRVVEVVGQRVAAQIQQNPQLAANPDFLPLRLMGTFILLRWVMEFQLETQGDPSPEGMQRVKDLTLEYMQIEHAIALGTSRRNGRVAQECQKDGPNRADFRTFPSAEACHRHVLKRFLSNIYPSFTWRNEIFPLLFCDRAAFYLALMQDNILTLPAPIPSPAVAGEMPDGSPLLGAGVCKAYGADANANGLCDDWERPPAATSNTSGTGSGRCAPIGLKQVRMAPGGGLKVLIDPKTAKPGTSVRFRLQRVAAAEGDPAPQAVWEGEARIESGPDAASPLHALIAPGEKLPPDQERPFLLVDTTSSPSAGPVRCEQPLPVWLPHHEKTILRGLHGPYGSGVADGPKRDASGGVIATGRGADMAVNATGLRALRLTAGNEAGFLVLQDRRAPGRYYTTPPVPGSPPANSGANATVTNGDYANSLIRAFAGSCEVMEDFDIAAWAHTHPTQVWGALWFNDNFSMTDFNFAVEMRLVTNLKFDSGVRIGSALEGIYIIVDRNRCIRSFTPQFYDDKDAFTAAEIGQVDKMLAEPAPVHELRQTLWATLVELGMVGLSEHYTRFQIRQREIGCY